MSLESSNVFRERRYARVKFRESLVVSSKAHTPLGTSQDSCPPEKISRATGLLSAQRRRTHSVPANLTS